MNEIERKFVTSVLPDIPVLNSYTSEQHILQSADGVEERITHSGDTYFYERKLLISDTERTRDKQELSKDEFKKLSEQAHGILTRETLLIKEYPKTVIQIYKGEYEGLIRVEVKVESQELADHFMPEA